MRFPRELANCGKLHMASVLDGLEFLRHISGGTRPITAEECYMEPGP